MIHKQNKKNLKFLYLESHIYYYIFFCLAITRTFCNWSLGSNNTKEGDMRMIWIRLRLIQHAIVTYSVRHVVHLRGSVGVTWRLYAPVLRIRVPCIFYAREERNASELAGIGADALRHANHITAVYCASPSKPWAWYRNGVHEYV